MTVIALINQKGGCGKSTTSVHLAEYLRRANKDAILIDADAQQSSSKWVSKMVEPIAYQIMQDPDTILDVIPTLKNEYLIVDGPASLSDTTRNILWRTDLAIIPCQPTGLDLSSAMDSVKLVLQAQSVRNGMPKAALFLNRATPRTSLKNEAIATLESIKVLPLLQTVIHQKQAIADSSGQRTTVWGINTKAAQDSAAEYEALFAEVLNYVG
jgi:chromosome partitioning protein